MTLTPSGGPRATSLIRDGAVECARQIRQKQFAQVLIDLGCDPAGVIDSKTPFNSEAISAGNKRLTAVLARGVPSADQTSHLVARGAILVFASTVLGPEVLKNGALGETKIGKIRNDLQNALVGETTPQALIDSVDSLRRMYPESFAGLKA